MTINRISIQAEIDAAYDHGYREGRLGGNGVIPIQYDLHGVLRKEWQRGYDDGERDRVEDEAATGLSKAAKEQR